LLYWRVQHRNGFGGEQTLSKGDRNESDTQELYPLVHAQRRARSEGAQRQGRNARAGVQEWTGHRASPVGYLAGGAHSTAGNSGGSGASVPLGQLASYEGCYNLSNSQGGGKTACVAERVRPIRIKRSVTTGE